MIISKTYNSRGTNVVVCTEPYRQVGMGRLLTSICLDGVMVSMLIWNAIDVSSIPIFFPPMTLGAMTRILYKLCAVWLKL